MKFDEWIERAWSMARMMSDHAGAHHVAGLETVDEGGHDAVLDVSGGRAELLDRNAQAVGCVGGTA